MNGQRWLEPSSADGELGAVALGIDAELAAIGESFDWLEWVTPCNVEDSWRQFQSDREERAPRFDYHPLALDFDACCRRLAALPVGDLGDPVLAALFAEKQRELQGQLALLQLRETAAFLPSSLDLFGGVDPELRALAEEVLLLLRGVEGASGGAVADVAEVVAVANAELAAYASRAPAFPSQIVVCDELAAGLMVSRGVLRISRRVLVPAARLPGLLQHEIGTHLLTFHNGACQPLRQLALGLAYYDTLQEGLGVLGEYLLGGLTPGRLRVLAARVLAVAERVEGGDFVGIYRAMRSHCGLGPRSAFDVTLRVCRGGGLTKDAVYLRGLRDLLAWLREGKPIELLFVGKIALFHTTAVETLLERGVLRPPDVLPRYLWTESGDLASARHRGLDVLGLARECAGGRHGA